MKNYYNSTSGNCNSVNSCLDNESYDYLTNQCLPIEPDTDSFPNNTLIQNSTLTGSNNSTLSAPDINCLNGKEIPNSNLCICYPGWTDDNTSNTQPSLIMKCNGKIPGFSNSTSGNSTQSNSSNFIIINPTNSTTNTNIIPVNFFKLDSYYME